MSSVKFFQLAQNELDDLYEAYEYKQKNLGRDFIRELRNTLRLIEVSPDTWQKSSAQTQRCIIKGYPYGVMYQKADDIIYVVAIINLLKKPVHLASNSISSYARGRISILPETIYVR